MQGTGRLVFTSDRVPALRPSGQCQDSIIFVFIACKSWWDRLETKGVVTVDRSADIQLNDLKKIVLMMGAHVENALEMALQGLTKAQPEKFKNVHEIEERINEAHVLLDNSCFLYLAKQGPVAKDLRFVLSLTKINTDLERMGDQTVNIAHTGKDHLARQGIPWPIEIEEMAKLARQMVGESLDSFVREDVELAKKILLMDDEVDSRKGIVFRKMIHEVKANSQNAEAAMDLILIARNLERLGDHATNIAEDVIFLSTGEDVRHGGKSS